MRRLALTLTLILVYSFTLTLGASLGGFKSFNTSGSSEDVANYLEYYYADDADCWQWINGHTVPEDRIASFEIRYYYIEREIFPLDCQDAAALYSPDLTIDEAIEYLKDRDVKYILSPGWVSTSGILPAYGKLVLTPYLGNPQYLPAVYVHGSTAIYHVGRTNVESLIREYLERDTVPPVPGVSFELNTSLENGLAFYYLEVPGDYHGRATLAVHVLSNSSNTKIEIWEGAHKDAERLAKASPLAAHPQRLAVDDSELNWLLKGGSYILVIRSSDDHQDSSQLRLSLAISEEQCGEQ